MNEADADKQLILPGHKHDKEDDSSDYSSGPDEQDLPPGPVDPDRCAASGPGYAGAAAGAPVKLVITAKDSSGKRIREGGAYVQVYVEPIPSSSEQARIDAAITDHNDGTYTAVYTVPSKGNYKLSIDINGQPLGGSPFPLFFSAPEVATFNLSAAPPMPTDGSAAAADPAASGLQQLQQMQQMQQQHHQQMQQQMQMAGGVPINLATAFPNLGGPAMNLPLGQQAVQMGVKFPTEDLDKLGRMLLVGGISPFATPEQLRSVFGFCGAILSVDLTGPANSYAFVEYGSPAEATAALAMNGVQLLGQSMTVESARAAKASAESAPPPIAAEPQATQSGYVMLAAAQQNPFLSVQMQQLQQFQMLQQQQSALAEQVATMRMMQRAAGGGQGGAKAPLYSGSNDSQKSAAIAAAIALSKRLAGSNAPEPNGAAGGATEAQPAQRKRSSRSRSRSREKSKRARSRSQDKRDRSRERSKRGSSRERRRARSRDKRDERRSERDKSRDRKDRDRRDGKDRDRDRDRRDRERSSRDDRSRREKDSGRDKDRERDSRKSKDSRRDKSRERDSKRDRSERKDKPERSEPEREKSSKRDVEEAVEQQQQQQPSKSEPPAGDDLEDLLNELGN